jgi:hypothetical protein
MSASNRSQHFAPAVIGRDRVCQVCSSLDNLQAHHVVPITDGGSDTPENGEALCQGCHADKHPDVPRGLFFSGASGSIVQAPYNATTLAAKLGCSVRTVTRKAKAAGIKRWGQRWAFCDADIEKMKVASRARIGIADRPRKPPAFVNVKVTDETQRDFEIVACALGLNPSERGVFSDVVKFSLRIVSLGFVPITQDSIDHFYARNQDLHPPTKEG